MLYCLKRRCDRRKKWKTGGLGSSSTRRSSVRGTRLAVELIIDLLAQGWTEAEILNNYPGLTREDVQACLSYASATLRAEKVYPIAAA